MNFRDFLRSNMLIGAMAGGLILLALVNEHLLWATEVTAGVHWIYLPAGLRMCFVLLLPLQGTLAIFLGSLYMASLDPSLDAGLVCVNAAVTAAGPILAQMVARHWMGLHANLDNLSARRLLSLAIVFGSFSTTLHQAFFAALGRQPAFMSMWVGDTVGCLLCLYIFKGLFHAWQRRACPVRHATKV